MDNRDRSFTVVEYTHGKQTVPKNAGRYISRQPADAAKKAARVIFRELGQNSKVITLTIRETTRGSPSRQFSYKATREGVDSEVKFGGEMIPVRSRIHIQSVGGPSRAMDPPIASMKGGSSPEYTYYTEVEKNAIRELQTWQNQYKFTGDAATIKSQNIIIQELEEEKKAPRRLALELLKMTEEEVKLDELTLDTIKEWDKIESGAEETKGKINELIGQIQVLQEQKSTICPKVSWKGQRQMWGYNGSRTIKNFLSEDNPLQTQNVRNQAGHMRLYYNMYHPISEDLKKMDWPDSEHQSEKECITNTDMIIESITNVLKKGFRQMYMLYKHTIGQERLKMFMNNSGRDEGYMAGGNTRARKK